MSSWRDLLFEDWSDRASSRARSLFVPTVSAVAVSDLIGLSNADDAVMLLLWAGFILTGLRRLAEEYPVAIKLLHQGGP